jgi:hypothetical protein
MRDMEWTIYRFVGFGVTCDIFRDARAAIDLDERMPNEGYLAQEHGPLALTVSYGAAAALDVWLQRALSGPSSAVSVVEKSQGTLCGRRAERVVLGVTPPPSPAGTRAGPNGLESMAVDSGDPFLLVALSGSHRQTPLLATFRRPLPRDAPDPYAVAEAHFFSSFRCAP